MADSNLEYKITTTAELRALRDLESSLQRQIVQAKALGKDYKDLGTQLAGVQKQIGSTSFGGRLTADLQGLAERIPVVGEGIRSIAGMSSGLAGGFAAASVAIGAAGKAVAEFAASEAATTKLDAALARTGQLTDDSREKFQALAQQLQDTTGIAADEWMAVLSRVVQFGATSANINQNAEAVKNLAGVMGGDLQGAALLVGKAMQGNFSAFARLGIKIDENASQSEKLAALYKKLADMGGGALAAQNNTLIGQWNQLKLGAGDLMENIGRLIAKGTALHSVLFGLAESAKWLAGIFGGTNDVVEGIQNSLRGATETAEQHEQAVRAVADAYAKAKSASDDYNQKLKDQTDWEIEIIRLEKDKALALLESEKARRSGTGNEMGADEEASRRASIEGGASRKTFEARAALLDKQLADLAATISGSETVDQTTGAKIAIGKDNYSTEQIDKIGKIISDAKARAQKARATLNSSGGPNRGFSSGAMDVGAQEDLRQAEADIARWTAILNRANSKPSLSNSEMTQAEAVSAENKKVLDEARRRQAELQKERERLGTRRQYEVDIEGARSQRPNRTPVAPRPERPSGPTPDQINRDFLNGKGVPTAAIESSAAGVISQFDKLGNAIIANNGELAGRVAAVEAELRRQASQSKNTGRIS